MQYLATIKKKSPMHSLWRRNKQYKVRFLDTLFTFNKATGEYYAQGNLTALGRLMRHPNVIVTVLTEPVEQAAPAITPVEPVIEPTPLTPETQESGDAEDASNS